MNHRNLPPAMSDTGASTPPEVVGSGSAASVDAAHDVLVTRIGDRTAVVGIVGLGYVGLPFAVEKAKMGFRVEGVEQNASRCDSVNQGRNYIGDVSDSELAELVEQGLIRARIDFDAVPEMDVVVICVPTPLTKNLVPDLQYVESVAKELAPRLRRGQLVTLESTTYPGTTDDVLRPILEKGSGLKAGDGFLLAYSPERVDPGNARYTTRNTNKVVGASDPASRRAAIEFYSQTIEHVVPVSSCAVAELSKVFENTFRAVNIALVNELTMLCDRMGLDVWEVLDAANSKPFGIMPFYPGPGVGGHCIPLDPHYLEWKAKEYNFNTHFIALAGEINRRMPEFVLAKALRLLSRAGVAPSRARVHVLGIAYKKDVDDYRESPAVELAEMFAGAGADVQWSDPYVTEIDVPGLPARPLPADAEHLGTADLVVIATDHTAFDYEEVLRHTRRLLDTRGVTRNLEAGSCERTLL